MKKLPIGFRLTLWYLLIFAVAQTIFGLGMWQFCVITCMTSPTMPWISD